MNKYALAIAIVLCHFLSAHASIINGFLQEKLMLQKEIRSVAKSLNEDNDDKAVKKIERELKKLRKKYAIVFTKYTETEQFISAIEFIDPELYAQVSKVTNAEGTLTHVCVRYVDRTSQEFTELSKNHFVAFAYTSVSQSPTNKNVCASINGTNTISITVGKGTNDKILLAHEFGHVLYMVPNLSDYYDFLNRNKHKLNKFANGHSPYDPSYAFVESIENEFRNKYKDFVKNENNEASL